MKSYYPFERNTAVKEDMDPMIYARALTSSVKDAKELVRLIKLVKEMGLTHTIAFDDEREFLSATSALAK